MRKLCVRLRDSTLSALEQLVKMEYVKFKDSLFKIDNMSDAVRFCIMVALQTLADQMWSEVREHLERELKPRVDYKRMTENEESV